MPLDQVRAHFVNFFNAQADHRHRQLHDPLAAGEPSARGQGLSGGSNNVATGVAATVTGGTLVNMADGQFASVSGGTGNMATGQAASVSGGNTNFAIGPADSVSGGMCNQTGFSHPGTCQVFAGAASVSGGFNNVGNHGAAVTYTDGPSVYVTVQVY